MSGQRELPVLDVTRCTGCGDCTVVCPTDCLAMRWNQPVLDRPRACVSCVLCVEVCPEDALALRAQWCG